MNVYYMFILKSKLIFILFHSNNNIFKAEIISKCFQFHVWTNVRYLRKKKKDFYNTLFHSYTTPIEDEDEDLDIFCF